MPKDHARAVKAVLTITEAAAELGIARSSFYELAAAGRIGTARLLGRPAVLRTDIDRLLAEMAAEAEAARQAAAAAAATPQPTPEARPRRGARAR